MKNNYPTINYIQDPIKLINSRKIRKNDNRYADCYNDISADVKIVSKMQTPKPIVGKMFISPRVQTRRNCKRLELYSPKIEFSAKASFEH